MKKDIIIEIKNLPPAAYDTLMGKVQKMSAELMRTMAQNRHLLDDDSTIATTTKPSANNSESLPKNI